MPPPPPPQVNNYTETELQEAGMKPFRVRKLINVARATGTTAAMPGPPPGSPPGFDSYYHGAGAGGEGEGGGARAARASLESIAGGEDGDAGSGPGGGRSSSGGGSGAAVSEAELADADALLDSALDLLRKREVDRAVVFCEQALFVYKAAWKQTPPGSPPPLRAAAAFGLAAELFR